MTALDDYLAAAPPGTAPTVRALDDAIRHAHAEFDVAIKYRILMYALAGDWRRWVVAIDARPRAVSLKFLAGVLLDDLRGVLRAGTSVLKSWDFAPGEPIDTDAVVTYVTEAVRRYPEYRANEKEIVASARAAATKRKRGG